MTGATTPKQYPRESLPELAFAGRSNVGKSSLINSLLNRKKLVKTSSTPGKTQMINFFKINDEMIFADLPGYGFAKVPLDVKKRWQKMIEQYLLKRETLIAVVLIVDIRRNPTQLDLDLQNWLENSGIDYIFIATKADKLSRPEMNQQIRKIKEFFLGDTQKELVVYSSKSGRGKKELWDSILRRSRKKKTRAPKG